jgi:hypothetical protein
MSARAGAEASKVVRHAAIEKAFRFMAPRTLRTWFDMKEAAN